MTVQVKICGIKTLDIALCALDFGVDYIGFNFSPESKRRVLLKEAVSIYNELKKRDNKSLSIVGLFYKNSMSDIENTLKEIPFDFLQFVTHDQALNLEQAKLLHKRVIPQISVRDKISDNELEKYDTELLILDSYKEGLGGGSGNTFAWENAKSVKRKYLLAGGLNPSNVKEAISVLQPFGVDVASGVETSPGEKDRKLIEEFIKNAKRI